jgi:hypothetical protein
MIEQFISTGMVDTMNQFETKNKYNILIHIQAPFPSRVFYFVYSYHYHHL